MPCDDAKRMIQIGEVISKEFGLPHMATER